MKKYLPYAVLKVQPSDGPVAQLVRASPCHGEGRRFESDLGRFTKSEKESVKDSLRIFHGILAQLGEHLPYKQRVIGSSPIGPTKPAWRNWQTRRT